MTQTILFDTIKEQLKNDDALAVSEKSEVGGTDGDVGGGKFAEMVLVVYLVFNISKKLNNPPNPRYIDINLIKKTFYKNKFLPLTDQLTKLKNIVEATPVENEATRLLVSLRNQIQDNAKTVTAMWERLESIRTLITQIDNHNDSTALGTLEFTDSVSRLGVTNTVCTLTEQEALQLHPYDSSQPSSSKTQALGKSLTLKVKSKGGVNPGTRKQR